MGTLRAIYVRLRDREADVSTIRKSVDEDRPILTETGKEFAQVEWYGFEPPRRLLQQLSRDLATDVIWLLFQSAVDAFAFEHWNSGKRGRTLVFACFGNEAAWECAEGQPEEWEPAEVRRAKIGEFGNLNSRELSRTIAKHYGFAGWS